jgi:hypothetical protein
MRKKALTPLVVTAAVACALSALPASAAAATDVQQAASQNWSGYVASSSSAKNFSSVSGSWTQPTANCSTGSGYAAFWVGLGGSGSSSNQNQALEQAGTEADCSSSGQATYFAWYELVPAAPAKLALTVKPGDRITTRVGVSGSTVTVNLSDVTSGRSASKTLTMNNPDTSSAEWIAEAPSSCSQMASNCSPLPLTNFGTVKFSNATATASDGHTGGISDPEWTATEVALQSGASGYGGPQFTSDASSGGGATPSGLGKYGQSFSVAWSDGSSSSPTGSGGYGSGSGGYGPGSGGYGDPGGYGYGGSSGYSDGGGYGYPGGYGYYGGGYAYSY